MVGTNFLSLIPESEQKAVMDNISALKVESPTQSHEHTVIAPNGAIRWQRWTNRALFDNREKTVGYQSIGMDITERKQAEEALRTSHETFLTVLDGIDATIYVADMESHEILFMNKYMIESFGRDVTGEICWDVFRGESEPCPHCNNDQLIDENGKPAGVCIWQDKNPITEKWYINHRLNLMTYILSPAQWTNSRI